LFEDATVKVIPNGLDVESFRPRESNTVRSRLSIDPEVKLICFGADWETPRKGTDLLYEALENIDTQAESVQVAMFGHMDTDTPDPDVPIHRLGFVDDEVLQALYSDADVMVVPSRQEAFGQTASEALASGTPVVAFNATGPKDIVDHKRNGYLATPFDTDDLAQGIDWVLADTDRRERLSKRARKSAVEQFSIKTVSNQYQKLYKKLLE
jgi:glycosyltransferase involved in cell wall biosynthesis